MARGRRDCRATYHAAMSAVLLTSRMAITTPQGQITTALTTQLTGYCPIAVWQVPCLPSAAAWHMPATAGMIVMQLARRRQTAQQPPGSNKRLRHRSMKGVRPAATLIVNVSVRAWRLAPHLGCLSIATLAHAVACIAGIQCVNTAADDGLCSARHVVFR